MRVGASARSVAVNTKYADRVTSKQQPSAVERITVNLTARSQQALTEAVARNGDNKTDTINRALQLYNFLDELWRNDGAVYVRQQPGGELERLRVF